MKKLIGLAAFVTMGLFTYSAQEAPAASAADADQVAQMSWVSDPGMGEPDSLICNTNCCEINAEGKCVSCHWVCP